MNYQLSQVGLLKVGGTVDYIALSQKVMNAQNRARMDPKAFSIELLEYGDKEASKIVETLGVKMDQLVYSPGLRKACNDMVKDQSTTGALGHAGSDKSTPFDRMNRYGKWSGLAGENIMYGGNDAIGIMAGLIKSPLHRKNIFTKEFTVVGASCGTHKVYGVMTVINYASKFTSPKLTPLE